MHIPFAPRLAFIPLATLLLLATIACNGGDEVTPTQPNADDLRNQTIALLEQLSTVEFTVGHPNEPTDMGGGLTLTSVDGVAAFPDRAEMTAQGAVQRVAVEFGIVQFEGTTYFRGPIGDAWRTVDPSALPFDFVGMNLSVADALSEAEGIAVTMGERIGGEATYRFSGAISSDDLGGLVPGAESGLPLDLTAWIRASDGMPLRVVLEGRIIAADPEGMVRRLDLGGFDETVSIEPPI